MPAISVIIPVYNVEQYLRECLDSVVNQTFRDLEIICVNDGSTDGSPAILEEYAAKDSRIRIVNKENGGLSDARNAGLSIASGEYIQFVDSDDYLDLNACQTLYSKAIESKSDMVMFLFNCFGIFEKRSSESVSYFPAELTDDLEKIQYEYSNWQTAWSNLFRRDFIEQNGLRFHKGLIFEDLPFITKASLLANKIVIVPLPLYYYRQREGSIMRDKQQKSFLSRSLSYKKMIDDILPLNPDKKVLDWLLTRKFTALYQAYFYKIKKSDRRKMRQTIIENASDEEYSLLLNSSFKLNSGIRNFYLQFYGSTFNRFKYRLKFIKGRIADFFARFLFPHSPWLQGFGEREEEYKQKYEDLCQIRRK